MSPHVRVEVDPPDALRVRRRLHPVHLEEEEEEEGEKEEEKEE